MKAEFIVIIFFFFLGTFTHLSCSGSSNTNSRSYLSPIEIAKAYGNSTLATFGAMVGIASSNVPAYSNGNDSYISNQSNYFYGIYTGMPWQCVEYARRWLFIRKGCVFDSVDAADDMWTQLTKVQRVVDGKCFSLTKNPNGSPSPPKNESLLIYSIGKDMPFGHVSVIVDVLPGSIRVAEQNFHAYYWSDNYSRQIPYVKINGGYYINDSYTIYGWMSIEDNQQTSPLDLPTINQIIKNNISFPDFICSNSITRNCASLYNCLIFISLTILFPSIFLRLSNE